MRIAIDARQISHSKRHGLRTYVENLVEALAAIDNKNEYILYLDAKDDFTLDFLGPNFTLKILPWHIKFFSTLLNDHFFLPYHLKKDKVDLVHYPANPVNFRPSSNSTRSVITVHDALPFIARKSPIFKRIKNQGVLPTLVSWYNTMLIGFNARRNLTVITISHKSKNDLIQLAKATPERIKVIHEAANDSFRIVHDDNLLSQIKREFNLGSKFILGFAHKNGSRIVEAYAKLPNQIKSEYRVGLIWLEETFPSDLQKIISEFNLSKQILCIPPVSEEDLVLLYNAASLFVFPSFYEGFGLPVVEAMKCGCPVICSDRGSLPEVAGDAAVFINELDNIQVCVAELSGKIQTVLTSEHLQKKLIRNGLKHARKFSWKKTATHTLKVYEEFGSKLQ